MINRELIRLKTIQVVYSTEVNSDRRPDEVEDELVRSLGTAYDLYNTMLSLMVAISASSAAHTGKISAFSLSAIAFTFK